MRLRQPVDCPTTARWTGQPSLEILSRIRVHAFEQVDNLGDVAQLNTSIQRLQPTANNPPATTISRPCMIDSSTDGLTHDRERIWQTSAFVRRPLSPN